jgi:phosphoribosylformimino-5-aminoimidazole carboxamide ribotide isomerase
MLIFPAIDLRQGKCVRLYQGRPEAETVYADDPVAVAREWQKRGAGWLHVVDLDGAFAGEPQHLELIGQIAQAVDIPVQLGGGIRSLATIDRILTLGVSRVILGTAAVSDPGFISEAIRQYSEEQIVIGIDSTEGMVAIRGWETTATKTAVDFAREVKALGVTRVVYTDTKRDGTLTGPNIEGTRTVAAASGLKVIAAGGIGALEDIRRLHLLEPTGVEGVILGKALYTGAVQLEEALAIVQNQPGV